MGLSVVAFGTHLVLLDENICLGLVQRLIPSVTRVLLKCDLRTGEVITGCLNFDSVDSIG